METIEEKASAFSGMNEPHPRDLFTMAVITGLHDGFKAGAEWMLGKAMEWLNENAQNYYKDAAMRDGQMIEDFQKAMEE